jgi:hypothetical protein
MVTQLALFSDLEKPISFYLFSYDYLTEITESNSLNYFFQELIFIKMSNFVSYNTPNRILVNKELFGTLSLLL